MKPSRRLSALDDLSVRLDWSSVERRLAGGDIDAIPPLVGPPPSSKRWVALAVGTLAAVVTAASLWIALPGLTPVESGNQIPHLPPGVSLWPFLGDQGLAELQDRVRGGADMWRLDARRVGTEFGRRVMGWTSFEVTLQPGTDDRGEYSIVMLTNMESGVRETLTLRRAFGVGSDMWVVAYVESSELSIGMQGGETVSEGTAIAVRAPLRPSSAWGVGSFPGECLVPYGAELPSGESELTISRGASLENCRGAVNGLLWIAAADRPLVSNGDIVNPLVGDGSYVRALAASPFALAPSVLPEWNSYKDDDWELRYPAEWSSGRFDGATYVSNRPMSDEELGAILGGTANGPSDAAVVVVAPMATNSETLDVDTRMPLDVADIQPGSVWGRRIQGNGAAYQVTVTVGGDVSTDDAILVAQTAESLAFRSLRPLDRQADWMSMGPAVDFPIGDVTLWVGDEVAVGVAHGDRDGFYALRFSGVLCPPEIVEGSGVVMDGRDLVFTCADNSVFARFDEFGRFVGGSDDAPDELPALRVIEAWDGALLLSLTEIPPRPLQDYWR